ncbi:MAG: zinc-ribbon domain-containing protein [Christensenellales bacterium]
MRAGAVSLTEYCNKNCREQILEEWDAEKNGDMSPDIVSYGSHTKVWWKCGKGHSWQAAVYSRAAGVGCPFCSGRMLNQEDSLGVRRPAVAAQWHPTKNGSTTPYEVSYGSHRRVWWLCEHGHEWRAMVKSRAAGTGCPYCANRVLVEGDNDLMSHYPDIAAEWDYDRNAPLLPQNVISSSQIRVWWKCKKGHSYKSAVVSRAAGTGCPYCANRLVLSGFNDLKSMRPDLAAEWDGKKNGSLTPDKVTEYSNRKVWWRCEKNHGYKTLISLRASGDTGCPYCANRLVLPGFNDLATVAPLVARQWHPSKNGSLTPEMVTAGSHKTVWWKCDEGHEWKAVIYSRAGKSSACGCPECAGRKKRS